MKESDKIQIVGCLNSVTHPDIPDGWRMTNFLQLGIMMKVCYEWDTENGKQWNQLTYLADEIVKARKEHGAKGEDWKKHFIPLINKASDKEALLNMLRFMTNPSEEIKVDD